MANGFFSSRPHFEDRQIVQWMGESIHLSGQTNFDLGGFNSYIYDTYQDFLNGVSGATFLSLPLSAATDPVSGWSNNTVYSPGVVRIIPPRKIFFSGNTNVITGVTQEDVTGYIPVAFDSQGTVVWTPFSGITATSGACSDYYVSTIYPCSSGGTVTIEGNLTIKGVTTSGVTIIDTEIIRAEDNNMELNWGGNHTTAIGGGITVLSGQSNSADSSIYTLSDGTWMFEPGLSATTIPLVYDSSGTNSIIPQLGGHINDGTNSSILGGSDNAITGGTNDHSVIAGGSGHRITGQWNTIIGGSGHVTSSVFNSIIGGQNNTAATGGWSVIAGGTDNVSGGFQSFIGGGDQNTIGSFGEAAIIGGYNNNVQSNRTVIIGGQGGTIGTSSDRSVILGGRDHSIVGTDNGILGGRFNYITQDGVGNKPLDSVNIGGILNEIRGYTYRSTIIGGYGNLISGLTNTHIIGGTSVTATTSNMVYVPSFNIGTVGSNTAVTLLALDSNGNVVNGSALSGSSTVWTSGVGSNSVKTINPSTTEAYGSYAMVQGFNCSASGTTAVALGFVSEAHGDYSMAIGSNCNAYGEGSFAGGLGTGVGSAFDSNLGKGSFSFGNSGSVSSWWSMSVGQSNSLYDSTDSNGGYWMYAFGSSNTLASDYSFSFGQNNDINGSSTHTAILGGKDNLIKTGATYSSIMGGSGNTINDDVTHTVILGGNGISATSSNTTYVENLNISKFDGGVIQLGLGIDSNGMVVTGSTGSADTNFANDNLTFDDNRTHQLGGYNLTLSTSGNSNTFNVYSGGTVGIKTTTLPSFDLEVNGTFGATSKSFVIPHPLKEGKKLVHGAIEGPEFGVYDRGRFFDGVIELPDYWVKLVDESTITVQLTGDGFLMSPFVKEIKDNKVFLGNRFPLIKASGFYTVYGERKDIDKIKLEIDA